MRGAAEPASDKFVYSAHASYKSQTVICIQRKPRPTEICKRVSPKPQNPYVFKSKSYSTKRHCPPSTLDEIPESIPNKKLKPDLLLKKMRHHSPVLDAKKIEYQLYSAYLDAKFFEAQIQEEIDVVTFPLSFACNLEERKNQLLSHQIQIVSCENQKINVDIHEGLWKANTSQGKVDGEHFFKDIVNPFNLELRMKYLEIIPFIKEYKSGYAPIDLQNKNNEEVGYDPEQYNKPQNTRSHFIRKKQSTLTLPRSCGVSYIRESESQQREHYDPLPPIIFQCSSNCAYNQQVKNKFKNQLRQFIEVSENSWLPFIQVDEENMRDLLLGKRVGKVSWVYGIQNLWPLFAEGVFILVIFSEENLISEADVWNSLTNCLFKIGMLIKRSTSGKKSFLNSIRGENQVNEDNMSVTTEGKMSNLQMHEEKKEVHEEKESEERKKSECQTIFDELAHQLKDCRTVITLSIKLQMYVEEFVWKTIDKDHKTLLNAMIMQLKGHLQKKSIQIIRERFHLSREQNKKDIFIDLLSKIKKPSHPSFQNLQTQRIQQEKTFNIQHLHTLLESKLNSSNNTKQILQNTTDLSYEDVCKHNLSESSWEKSLKMPIYYISTRDSFAFDLVERITILERDGRPYKKIDYYFEGDNLPSNFGDYLKMFPTFYTGVTCYHGFFTHQELKQFEQKTLQTEKKAFKNKFLQMTVQPSIVGNRIKRTKFFFGYRYMWTRCQLAEPMSYVGAGVRKDVTLPPKWVKNIQNPMVEHGIVEKDFINSVAINVYHDGKEGLAQHFDDAVRFKQPIYTLRLVSDGRLSFGSQFYGFCNGAFIVPLPRGCICVMNESSYAANGVKHCVRPCDMTGKSAAVILRQMHHQVVNQSAKYDKLIDFPNWLSTVSTEASAVTYSEQKRRQSEFLLKGKE